jgi:hypothetical protein
VVEKPIQQLGESPPYLAWKAKQIVVSRTNYRSRFEPGAMQPIVEWLSQGKSPSKAFINDIKRRQFQSTP